MEMRRDSKKDGAAQASMPSARKTRTRANHVGNEERDSGGSLTLAGDFRRRSLPCTTPENLSGPGVPAAARSLGPCRRRRQVGGRNRWGPGGPRSLAPAYRRRSLDRPAGGARWSGWRRGSRGGVGVDACWSAGRCGPVGSLLLRSEPLYRGRLVVDP
jgi:hypothetical protein